MAQDQQNQTVKIKMFATLRINQAPLKVSHAYKYPDFIVHKSQTRAIHYKQDIVATQLQVRHLCTHESGYLGERLPLCLVASFLGGIWSTEHLCAPNPFLA